MYGANQPGDTPTRFPGIQGSATGITINNNGGGNAHENLPPTVFIPYIVCLHG